jgi:hypothetical protein
MKSSKIEIDLPSVSVIIPAYNEEKWIETTISSVIGHPEYSRVLGRRSRSSPTRSIKVRERRLCRRFERHRGRL